MLAAAALLAFVMAVLAPINHDPAQWRGPPDEHGHRAAARYYVDHWLPPQVGDPATLESYSRDYGFSYINDPDLAYPLAGKFAALISPVVPDVHLGFRLFNVSLLAALAVLCFLRPASWPLFLPLLLSPQVWYIFSYFNGDALPLFLAVLLALQVVEPASRFNRFLAEPGLRRHWSGPILVGLLVAAMLLGKKNFLTFVALLPAVVALLRFNKSSALLLGACAIAGSCWYLYSAALADASMWQKQASPVWAIALGSAAILAAIFAQPSTRRERAGVIGKLALLGVVAAAVIAPRFIWDARVHGSLDEKRVAIGKVQEQVAKPDYKPSTIYAQDPTKTYYGIGLRGRGVPLAELFEPKWNWHKLTLVTGTGAYGWIQFTAGTWYYGAMLALYAAIFGLYAFATWAARSAAAWTGFALVAAFSALTVGIALFHSWNNDFQAQGRYLFPILPMLGVGLLLARDWIPRAALVAAAGACFLLGLYSFVFIGLRWVPGSF